MMLNLVMSVDDRNRKALESRSLADDERITFLETQLKEAKYIAEDADRKYDEARTDFGSYSFCDSVCFSGCLQHAELQNKSIY